MQNESFFIHFSSTDDKQNSNGKFTNTFIMQVIDHQQKI